jgi:hypothetical protein
MVSKQGASNHSPEDSAVNKEAEGRARDKGRAGINAAFAGFDRRGTHCRI